MDKVRIGIIGCGGISKCHIDGVKILVENGCKEIEITALCDERRENVEEKKEMILKFQKNEPITFTDYEELISKKNMRWICSLLTSLSSSYNRT